MSIKTSQSSAPATQAASVSSLQARVESHPDDGESWLALALRLAHSRPTQELRQAISRSIELLPDNYQAWLLAGLELQQRLGFSSARQWLEHIVHQRPALAAPRLALAQLLAAAQDQAAENTYASIIAGFPDDARACLLYAEYLQHQGRPGAAGDYLERALGLQPDIAENWISLAKIRLVQQRFEAAVSAATQALKLDPNAPEAHMTRAEAYRQAAQWQLAKSDYQILLQFMPDNPYVLMGIGACLAGEGEFAEALAMLARALQIKPDFHEARLNIALVHACQGDRQTALSELEQLVGSGAMFPAMQDAARICQAALLEQQRLQKYLQAAAQSTGLPKLQAALNQAPPILLQPDPHMADSLHSLAEASRQVQWPDYVTDDNSGQHGFGTGHPLAFIEACLLSRTASSAADIATLWAKLPSGPPGQMVLQADRQPLLETWQAILDRTALLVPLQGDGTGEAWLRYWHYRLFRTSAAHVPGQFKFAPNSIGLHQTTAPQCVASMVRLLMDEIHPSLPAGAGRACFMLVAIAWIHAFVDGNGRLARFVFAGELEAAGITPILLLTQKRKAMTDCLDHAQYDKDFGPFAHFLQQALASTRELQVAVAKALYQD